MRRRRRILAFGIFHRVGPSAERRMTQQFLLVPFAALLFILPFPGTVALRLLCLAAAFSIAAISWWRITPPAIPLKRTLFVWIFVAAASLLYAVDPAYSLGEIKNEVGYTIMAFVAFFAMTSDERRMQWMLLSLTLGALALCSWALVQVFSLGHWKQNGGYGGTAAFASYMAAIVPTVLLLGFYFKNTQLRIGAMIALILLVVTGYFCEQRIIWPVLFLQLFTGLILFRKVLGISQLRTVAALVLVLLLAAIALLGSQISRFDRNPFPAVTMENDSRLVFWPKVASRIMQHPVTGAGFGRGVMYKAYPDLTPRENAELWHAHNVILNYGLAMGFPGIVVLLAIWVALLREYARFWRSNNSELKMLGTCGIVLIIGVLARNMVNDMFVRDAAILFWAINGMLLGLGRRTMAAELSEST